MTPNEIKKLLYKEKPLAILDNWDDSSINYSARLLDGTIVKFKIPVEEGEPFKIPFETNGLENDYRESERAQLLIRWLV